MSFIDTLKTYCLVFFDWLKAHAALLISISVVSFIVGVLLCPLVIAYLPADYFLPNRRSRRIKHPVLRIGLKCLKNLIAGVLVIVGLILMILPGPGILTILIGIIISDIPGKRRLERRIICSPVVLAAANGIRSRFKRPMLVLDESAE